jgi:integrase
MTTPNANVTPFERRRAAETARADRYADPTSTAPAARQRGARADVPETAADPEIADVATRQPARRAARARVAVPTPHKYRRVMGTGHLFRQTGPGKSKNWSMQFYDADGVKRIKTSGTRDKTEARQRLNEILAAIGRGENIDHIAAPRSKVWTFDDAAALYLERLAADGCGTYKPAQLIENHLRPAFGGLAKFSDVTADRIRKFEAAKLAEGLSRATVNGYLAALRRMFRLSARLGKIGAVPEFELPDPKNARKGFFKRDQFDQVTPHLPEDLRLAVVFAYLLGWRLASEVCILTWETHVDRETKTVRLEPGEAKNDEGRLIAYGQFPALADVIDAAWRAKGEREARGVRSPLVFPQANGRPMVQAPCPSQPKGALQKSVRDRFNAACKAAGVEGRRPHDMRRSAARNLVTIAGIPENLAMKITGHLTRDVFDRYHIVNPADVAAALGQLATTDAGAPVTLATPEATPVV